ncbi:VC0807 family protein [Kribbella sp. NPDC049584]|uniref:VC0807 family protein n=1 Tax=Kribbella sp. NPDC049584 TaxID=3154833 RepID=UPI00341ECFA9
MTSWSGQPRRRVGLLSNRSLRLNVVAPVVAYWVLSRRGISTVDALALSAVFPAAGGLLAVLRSRKVDPLAVLSLVAIAIGLIAALLFHDGRILLVKESFTSGALGLVFLGSLLASKPAIFVLRRRLFVLDDDDAQAEYDGTWQSPAVRAEARRTTAIWGVALLAEAAVRVGLSYLLPVGAMVTISPLLAPLILGPLAIWNLRPRQYRLGEPAASDTPVPSRSSQE